MGHRPAATFFVVGVATSLATAPARAEGPLGALIAYDAPEACPTAADFLSRVRARASDAEFAADDEPADLRASLWPAPGGFRGRLESALQGHGIVAREVRTTPSCSDAASALALIAALAIHEEHPPKPAATPETAPSIAAQCPPPPPPPSDSEPQRVGERPSGEAPVNSSWIVGIGGGATTAIAPSWLPSGSVFVAHERRAAVAPYFFFAATHGAVNAEAGGGMASFALYSARLGICPVGLAIASELTVMPCAAVDAGLLEADGLVSSGRAAPRFASHAAAFMRAQAPLSQRWIIGVEGGAVIPFTRFTFVFDAPRTEVYQTAKLGASFGLGLGITIP